MKRKHCALLAVAVGPVLLVSSWPGTQGDISERESFVEFRENVAPVLATTCSARDESGAYVCHGRPEEEYRAAIKASATGKKPKMVHAFPARMSAGCMASCHSEGGLLPFSFSLDIDRDTERGTETATIKTVRQAVLAYQQAAKLARFEGAAKFAKLLRWPLASQAAGFGLYHGGGEIYENAADPEFRKLADWVALYNAEQADDMEPASMDVADNGYGEVRGTSEAETYFRDSVLPVFARNSCMSPQCHVFNHSSFLLDPGMPSEDLAKPISERFTKEQVSSNRRTSKGLIQTLVNLSGDVEQSRILRKNIPIEKGGVLHRGGNNQFFSGPEDPDYQIVKKWLSLERQEAVKKVRIDGKPVEESSVGKVRGVVFVRTRTDNYRRYLDIGKYLPGGDLYLLKLKEGETLETASGPAINLTARFHPGSEADVREPDVRYDGRAILFAMRVGEQDGLNIYEISLDESLDYVEGSFRRLSYVQDKANGVQVHFTDPTYVPDPADENAISSGKNLERVDVVFVSNMAGEVVQSVERGIVGEADGGSRETLIDFDRPERDGAFVGRRIYIVDGANKGEWRTIAQFTNRLFTDEKRSTITVDKPFPKPIDNSSIYVIERNAQGQPGFLPAYSVYGIKYPPPGKELYHYAETLTRITWNPVQELDLSVRSTGEVFFASQRSGCDKYGRPIFHVASCRRHLDTRFSFPTHQGNRSQVLVYADNNELPTGIDIHVGLDPDNLWESGSLNVSDHQFGPGLEARNPHDFSTGLFNEEGIPRTFRSDITNTRFDFKKQSPSHPRFVFKKLDLFPSRGPEAVSMTGFSPGGTFRDSVPLPDGGILVSHSPAPLDLLDPNARPDFDLYVLRGDPSLHPPGGKGTPRIRKIRLAGASAKGWSDIQAYPIAIRLKSKINAAKRDRGEWLIRPPGAKQDKRPSKYLERNYLLIDAIMRDPSPVGKHAAFPRNPLTGEVTDPMDRVKYVRMVEVLPMTPELAQPVDLSKIRNGDPESTLVSNGIHPRKRIVGEAPLQEDGSIFIQVPSSTPMIIQSLNEDRMALRQEARYYFFAPNETFTISPAPSETFQTCGACMGALSGRSDELFGSFNPYLGKGRVQAIRKAAGSPPPMGLEVKDRQAIDFVRDIQPLLDSHCVACHQGKDAPAGLVLKGDKTPYYNLAYENLMQLEAPASGWYGRKKYVSERDGLAIESYLIEKLYGKELKAPRKLTGDHPHPSPAHLKKHGIKSAPLTGEQRLLLSRWIDLGATFRGPQFEAPEPGQFVSR